MNRLVGNVWFKKASETIKCTKWKMQNLHEIKMLDKDPQIKQIILKKQIHEIGQGP